MLEELPFNEGCTVGFFLDLMDALGEFSEGLGFIVKNHRLWVEVDEQNETS